MAEVPSAIVRGEGVGDQVGYLKGRMAKNVRVQDAEIRPAASRLAWPRSTDGKMADPVPAHHEGDP